MPLILGLVFSKKAFLCALTYAGGTPARSERSLPRRFSEVPVLRCKSLVWVLILKKGSSLWSPASSAGVDFGVGFAFSQRSTLLCGPCALCGEKVWSWVQILGCHKALLCALPWSAIRRLGHFVCVLCGGKGLPWPWFVPVLLNNSYFSVFQAPPFPIENSSYISLSLATIFMCSAIPNPSTDSSRQPVTPSTAPTDTMASSMARSSSGPCPSHCLFRQESRQARA